MALWRNARLRRRGDAGTHDTMSRDMTTQTVSSKPSQTRRLFESGKSAESVDPPVTASRRPRVPASPRLRVPMSLRPRVPPPLLRLAAGAGLIVIFLLLICNAGRAGFSSLMASYGSMTNQLAPANAAVVLCQTDPDAHYLRGTLLLEDNDLPRAIKDYEQAAALRPDDYVLWLSLAHARELN